MLRRVDPLRLRLAAFRFLADDLHARVRAGQEFSVARRRSAAGAFGTFAGHRFASLAPAAPLEAFVGDVRERCGWIPIESFRPDPLRSRDFEVAAHWALYVENHSKGCTSPSCTRAEQGGRLRALRQRAPPLRQPALALAKDGEPAFDLPPESPDHGRRVAAYYYGSFPT